MTILEPEEFELPASEEKMKEKLQPTEKIFICFISSIDPATGKMWCSDCRETELNVECHFNHPKQTKRLYYVEVGQKDEWKDPNNVYRKNWGITAIPTLARYVRGPRSDIVEMKVGKLVEKELKDGAEIKRFRDHKEPHWDC